MFPSYFTVVNASYPNPSSSAIAKLHKSGVATCIHVSKRTSSRILSLITCKIKLDLHPSVLSLGPQEITRNNEPGKLLPASFHGSPLKRTHDTEDALAIVNRRGRPQLFITITCNPEWPEIVENLLPGQKAADRPDLCCRVFKHKVDQLIADLKSGKVYGPLDFFKIQSSTNREAIHIPMLSAGSETTTLSPTWTPGFGHNCLLLISQAADSAKQF